VTPRLAGTLARVIVVFGIVLFVTACGTGKPSAQPAPSSPLPAAPVNRAAQTATSGQGALSTTLLPFQPTALVMLSDRLVVAGDSNGTVWISGDGGDSWRAGEELGGAVEQLAALPDGVVLAAIGANQPSLWRSADTGRSWGPVHLPVPWYIGTGPWAADGGFFVVVQDQPVQIFSNNNKGFILYSAGGGRSWVTALAVPSSIMDRGAQGLYTMFPAGGNRWIADRSGGGSIPDQLSMYSQSAWLPLPGESLGGLKDVVLAGAGGRWFAGGWAMAQSGEKDRGAQPPGRESGPGATGPSSLTSWK
jgi:hypothetical protein